MQKLQAIFESLLLFYAQQLLECVFMLLLLLLPVLAMQM